MTEDGRRNEEVQISSKNIIGKHRNKKRIHPQIIKSICNLEGLGSLDKRWGCPGSILGRKIGKGVGELDLLSGLLVAFGILLATIGSPVGSLGRIWATVGFHFLLKPIKNVPLD